MSLLLLRGNVLAVGVLLVFFFGPLHVDPTCYSCRHIPGFHGSPGKRSSRLTSWTLVFRSSQILSPYPPFCFLLKSCTKFSPPTFYTVAGFRRLMNFSTLVQPLFAVP